MYRRGGAQGHRNLAMFGVLQRPLSPPARGNPASGVRRRAIGRGGRRSPISLSGYRTTPQSSRQIQQYAVHDMASQTSVRTLIAATVRVSYAAPVATYAPNAAKVSRVAAAMRKASAAAQRRRAHSPVPAA